MNQVDDTIQPNSGFSTRFVDPTKIGNRGCGTPQPVSFEAKNYQNFLNSIRERRKGSADNIVAAKYKMRNLSVTSIIDKYCSQKLMPKTPMERKASEGLKSPQINEKKFDYTNRH